VAVAGLCMTGWAWALLLDAVLCAGVSLMLVLTGIVFLANGDMEGILSLVFGVVFGAAGWKSWQDFALRPRAGRHRRHRPRPSTGRRCRRESRGRM